MKPERYIAIDNVCAWPNLTRFPDGTIIATIFNQPTHGGWEGDIECWASTDDGKSWKLRGVPAPHEPGTNRMNVAAGLAHDGTFIVLASGWSKRKAAGNYSPPGDGKVLPIWNCRSCDAGKNWNVTDFAAKKMKKTDLVVPYGDIIFLPDNALGFCAYNGYKQKSYFFYSPDDGVTWELKGVLREKNANEASPVLLSGGKLMAAVRTYCDEHIELFSSPDLGASWSYVAPLTLGGQHPANFLVLKDGRLLLTYGIRNKGLSGIGARISGDNGRTWTLPELIVNLEEEMDCGYPACVQTGDGTIVTAYYSKRISTHQRYHMGVIRWRV